MRERERERKARERERERALFTTAGTKSTAADAAAATVAACRLGVEEKKGERGGRGMQG